jgi:hypothetical protein
LGDALADVLVHVREHGMGYGGGKEIQKTVTEITVSGSHLSMMSP